MASFTNEGLELTTALQGLRLSRCIDTGSFALLVYDYMLTFEDERTLIWPTHWSLPKVLFLLTRYLPFIDLSITASRHFRKDMTPEACWLAYQSAGWLINLGIMNSELLLVVRTWAVWGRTRFITWTLLAWVSVNSVANLVIMERFMKSVGFSALPAGISGCLVTSGNTLIIGVWTVLMVFEAGILSMMITKGIQMHRELGSSALYLAIFKDGAIFYVYIFALSVANVMVIPRISRDLFTLLASLERVTHAILTGRLHLTLHSTVSEPKFDDYDKLGTMKFDGCSSVAGTASSSNETGTGTVTTSLTFS